MAGRPRTLYRSPATMQARQRRSRPR